MDEEVILFAGGKLVFNWSGTRKCDSGVRGETEKNQVQHEHSCGQSVGFQIYICMSCLCGDIRVSLVTNDPSENG